MTRDEEIGTLRVLSGGAQCRLRQLGDHSRECQHWARTQDRGASDQRLCVCCGYKWGTNTHVISTHNCDGSIIKRSERKGGESTMDVTMRKARTTKNFVLYEAEKGSAVENLYVSQSHLPQVPEEITITLSF